MADKNRMHGVKEKFIAFQKRISPLLTKRNQIILFIITILAAALSIIDVICVLFPKPISIALYVVAALALFSSFPLWIKAIQMFFKVILIPFTEQNELIGTFVKDYKLRTVITALPGLGMNFIFAVFNAVIGFMSSSAWYGSLAAYYILLCAMRFISIMYAKSIYIDKKEITKEQRELKIYKNCGIMLSVMSVALMGAVIMLVGGVGGKSYPEVVTIAVAAYTFYKLTMSIIHMVKAKREKSLLLITLRRIGHSEALVALLSLQTAMFASFGEGAPELTPVMNAATGAAVCFIVLGLGIYMIFDAGKIQKKWKADFEGGTKNG